MLYNTGPDLATTYWPIHFNSINYNLYIFADGTSLFFTFCDVKSSSDELNDELQK